MPTYMTSDDAELYFYDQGIGPPIVFVPGWTMSGDWWRRQVPAFVDHHRVIRLDPRAHGQSSKVLYGHRLARYARDVEEMITGLGLVDVTLVGWSMGGNTLLAYADLFGGSRLCKMVLVDFSPRMRMADDWQYGFEADPDGTQLVARARADQAGALRELIPTMFHSPPPQRELQRLVRASLSMPSVAAADILEDHMHQDWRDILERIAVPTLVCSGGHSYFNSGVGRYVASRVQRGEFALFPDSGHCPFYEEAERFNEVLENFIHDLSRPPC